MAQMTITVQDAKVQDLLDAIAYFNPIPQVGSPPAPEFTKAEWARKWIKKYLNVTLNRYQNIVAKQAVDVPIDNTIVDVI